MARPAVGSPTSSHRSLSLTAKRFISNSQDLPREAQGQDTAFRPPLSTLPRRYSSAAVTLSGTARTVIPHRRWHRWPPQRFRVELISTLSCPCIAQGGVLPKKPCAKIKPDHMMFMPSNQDHTHRKLRVSETIGS